MRRSGCFLPLLILFIASALYVGGDGGADDWSRNPRRPAEEGAQISPPPGPERLPPPSIDSGRLPEFGIEEPGRKQDSQGTGFAVSSEGIWLTAEHVVTRCDRVGIATGEQRAERAGRIFESQVSDAAVITGGLEAGTILALSSVVPREGDDGYHMGFPHGEPAVVHSRFMGRGNAVRPGRSEAVLAWAEVERFPDFDHELGGISGGPTLDASGRVIGINSAAGERRGRILTTDPSAAINLLQASRLPAAGRLAAPIADAAAAAVRFRDLIATGAIRQVYCDVFE